MSDENDNNPPKSGENDEGNVTVVTSEFPEFDEQLRRQAEAAANPPKEEDKSKDKPKAESQDGEAGDTDKKPDGEPESKPAENASAKKREKTRKRIRQLNKRASTAESKVQQLENELEETKAKAEIAERRSKKQMDPKAPIREDYATDQEYFAALDHGEKKIEPKKSEPLTEQQRSFETALNDVKEDADSNAEKYPDFNEVVGSKEVAMNQDMIIAVSSTDEPAGVAYYLGKNPEESKRISELSPERMFVEMGKIEAKIQAAEAEAEKPPPKRKTNAPDPIKPVSGNSADPGKELKDMGFNEFAKARDQEEKGKKFW